MQLIFSGYWVGGRVLCEPAERGEEIELHGAEETFESQNSSPTCIA